MSVVCFLLAAGLYLAGAGLNLALPHLPGQLIIPGVAVVGALWVGAFGCALMGVASGIVDGLFWLKERRRDGRLWTY